MLIIFIRAILLYSYSILAVRLMGKRQIGQLQPYELVAAILIADLVAEPMGGAETPLLYGILLLSALPGLFFCKSKDYFTGLGLMIGLFCGALFEEKYVNFENTRNPVRAVLRVLGGGLLFLGLNTALKLPFPKDFLEGSSYAAMLVRCARYAVSAFTAFAIYPMLFKYTAKIGK